MKKIFKMQNVDCAHCAMKMQNEILKIEGVISASVNFLTQRLTLEFDDSIQEDVLDKARKACKKIDSDTEIIG